MLLGKQKLRHHAGHHRQVTDMEDWVQDKAVLRLCSIKVVRYSVLSNLDVLKQCISFDSTLNVWFGLLRNIDGLGVAPAFDVVNSIFVPTVFVVADQGPMRIGRRGCFA